METMYFIKLSDNSKYLSSLYKSSYSTAYDVDSAMKFENFQTAKAFSDYINSIEDNAPQMSIFKIETVITEAVEYEEVQ